MSLPHSKFIIKYSISDRFIGLATVANMGAEVGATTSTFPYTSHMRAYLIATARGPVARAADEAASQGFLSADEGAEYDEVIDIVSG
jgi:homoaconitase